MQARGEKAGSAETGLTSAHRVAGAAPDNRPISGAVSIPARFGPEILIVLGLSLGRSATYSIIMLARRLGSETALGEQSARLNESLAPSPLLDLLYQLLGIVFALVPVALALYLLAEPGRSAVRRIGLTTTRPVRDLGIGVGLAALIGVPGLAFYALGRFLDLTVEVQPAGLPPVWWAIPILILAALKNALLEEVLAVGYLSERLRALGWSPARILTASALLRGAYHLYQGIGPGIGNVVMGLVFAEYYRRRRRVLPLVIAHTLIDVVAFVGYALLPEALLALL
ncbi:MAG: CPBP family intramembrane metalloprotease [Bowdeniella nasicola]|nr:CPBP family intramembrane metalloprotease [Bowdeniella nasicola]